MTGMTSLFFTPGDCHARGRIIVNGRKTNLTGVRPDIVLIDDPDGGPPDAIPATYPTPLPPPES